MARPPEFSADTIRTLGERSALICNNPQCSTITVGPSDAHGNLKLKLGEAAHIKAKNKGARYDHNMTDKQRADISNAIWLCASCHTMVDNNEGADFPVIQLVGWKKQHEEMIRSLLLSHRSPVPLLRGYTEDGRLAQECLDTLITHGALFVDINMENNAAVIASIDRLRTELKEIVSKVTFDKPLKHLLQDIYSLFRAYMNETSNFPSKAPILLPPLRNRLGIYIVRLRDEWRCRIPVDLNRLIP